MEVGVMVNYVGRNIRTTIGNNLHFIKELTNLDPWNCTSRQVKIVLWKKLTEMSNLDSWRIPYLGKLVALRGELHHQMMDTTQLTGLIDSLCVN